MTGLRRPPLALVVLLAAAFLLALAGRASAALTVSPLPGTPDASPRTQISLLGLPASTTVAIDVHGSRSGRHRGRLRAYSTGDGASFLPRRPFAPGERVTVRVRWRQGRALRRRVVVFKIARPGQQIRLATPHVPVARSALHFQSRVDLHPPQLRVTTRASGTAPGYLFIAPAMAPGHRPPLYGEFGPAIVDDSGHLVWADPLRAREVAMAFRPQQLGGRPVLTWWQGRISPTGFSAGVDMIVDGRYGRPTVVRAGNGYHADLHEILLGPRGTAWIVASASVKARLKHRGDTLVDSVVQEIDIRTGLVEFEWHAAGHVPLGASYQAPDGRTPFDAYHLNSIDLDARGDLLLSMRNTWAVYLVDPQSGRIAWRLGGRHSSFHLGAGARFAWQHEARFAPGGVTLFDNEATPAIRPQSRALYLRLDRRHRSATVQRSLTHRPALSAVSQGGVQLLPNNDLFVSWGAKQTLSEFSPSGRLLYDARLPGPDESYRAYRAPWVGTPLRPPDIAVRRASGRVTVYASWNGATEVASWQLLTGAARTSLAPVTSVPRADFETRISAPSTATWYAVRAIDASGRTLGESAARR